MQELKLNIETEKGIIEVVAEPIKFTDYPDFQFVIYEYEKDFYIADSITNIIIPFPTKPLTKEGAIQLASSILQQSNQSMLRAVIRDTVMKAAYINEEFA